MCGLSAASLDGKVSRCHGHDSRVGRESLPEQLGIDARGGPLLKPVGPGGTPSRHRRRDSRVGWDYLPEHFGMGAHDGGISPYLGFSS